MTQMFVVYQSAVTALDEPDLDGIEMVVKFQST
jgi:hypothetical protein